MEEYDRANCVCSTHGFENALWNSDYYPEECPPDWRLAYFMNDFRAVFLPWQTWSRDARQIEAIADEIDSEFELIIEWQPTGIITSNESLLAQLAPLKQTIRAVVVSSADYARGMLDPLLDTNCKAIGEVYSVHLDAGPTDAVERVAGLEGRTGFVWHPGQLLEPLPLNGYLIVKLPCQKLRSIKAILIELKPLIDKNIRIGLFIEPAAQSVQRAMEVRTLIELMGLA